MKHRTYFRLPFTRLTLILLTFTIGMPAFATNVTELQRGWAIANYTLEGDDQENGFEALIKQADEAVVLNPNNAELLIWQAIIKSTFAGKTSGFTALSLVKEARHSLEEALEIDEAALHGSAYTSLGALYSSVPGWPIAFGSDKKARQLLETAVKLNPTGIDSNYFYASFLVQEKEYGRARAVLGKALRADPRPGRELADEGRRKEIRLLLQQIPPRDEH